MLRQQSLWEAVRGENSERTNDGGASAVLVAFRLGRERMDAQWRLRVTRVRRQLRAHKRKHPSTSHLVCELPCELPLSTDAVTLKP